jgi:hypothetical protein
VLAGFALMPVVMLPDLAWGVGGQLRPVAYPAEWNTVARQVAAAPGPVVSLPMSAYRAYAWNGRTVVFDPASRYLPAPVVTDDRLRVGSTVVAGEDPAAARVLARMAAGLPAADESVRWVLVQRDSGGTVPASALAGLVPAVHGPGLDLYRNPAYRPATPPPARGAALAGYLIAAAVTGAALRRRIRRPAPGTGPPTPRPHPAETSPAPGAGSPIPRPHPAETSPAPGAGSPIPRPHPAETSPAPGAGSPIPGPHPAETSPAPGAGPVPLSELAGHPPADSSADAVVTVLGSLPKEGTNA